ncbi:hypothetical protein TCAL_13861, partial [Tigriopus californicus]
EECQNLGLPISGKRKGILIRRILQNHFGHVDFGADPMEDQSVDNVEEVGVEDGEAIDPGTPTDLSNDRAAIPGEEVAKLTPTASSGGTGENDSTSRLMEQFRSMFDQAQKSRERREEELLNKITRLEMATMARDNGSISEGSVGTDPIRIKAAFRRHEERLRSAMNKLRGALSNGVDRIAIDTHFSGLKQQNRIAIDTHFSGLKQQSERFKLFVEEEVDWMDGTALKDQIQELAREMGEECDDLEYQANHHVFEAKKREEEDRRAGPLAATFKPPMFYGNPLEFPGFWEAFEVKFHLNHDVTMNGPAAELLSGLATKASHYEEALKLIHERFGRKRLIFRHVVRSILDQEKPMSSDTKSLRVMRDKFCNRLAAIRSHKVKPTAEMVLLPIMESKLPKDIREEWELKISQEIDGDGFATESQFISFLTAKVESKESAADCKIIDEPKDGRRSEPRDRPTFQSTRKYFSSQNLVAETEDRRRTVCPCCNQAHPLLNCPAFRAMDVNGRWVEFGANPRMYKACFRCLGPRLCPGGHGRFCPQVCSVPNCGKYHHALLHREDRDQDVRPEVTSALMTSSRASNTLSSVQSMVHKERILPTLWAVVRCGGGPRTVRESVADELILPVIGNISMEVHGFVGNVSSGVADVVRFELISSSGDQVGLEVQAVVKTGQICSPLQPVNLDVQQIPMLKQLDLSKTFPERAVDLDILLGADYCWKILGEIVPIPETELVLLKTKLGPTVSGTCCSRSSDLHSKCMLITLPHSPNDLRRDGKVAELSTIEEGMERFWNLECIGIIDIIMEMRRESLNLLNDD